MRLSQTTDLPLEAIRIWDRARTLFPRYDESEISALNDHVKTHSQDAVLPVVVSHEYLLIDGYNRLKAAEERGSKSITAQIYVYADEREMEIHAITLNAKRRHLDSIAAARAAGRLAELYEANEADTREKQRKHAINQHSKEGRTPATVQPSERRPAATEKAAREIGVSDKTVRAVAKVDATGDADLIGAMERKEVSIEKAAKLADQKPEVRKAAIELASKPTDAPERTIRALANNPTELIIAWLIDCTIRLREVKSKTDCASFTAEQARKTCEALDSVATEIDELSTEIRSYQE